jgi:very-short-patch-repair endonuclease
MLAQFRRDRLLRDVGYKVVHFTWRELFESPELVIARIRKALAAPSPY